MQRSLKLLREQGYTCNIVEKYVAAIRQRKDMGGFADLLYYRADEPGVTAVNVMHLRHQTEHDYSENKDLAVWLAAGQRFVLHRWHCVGPRGKVKKWEMVEEEIFRKPEAS